MKIINNKDITIRTATDRDLSEIINLLADDKLGQSRENSTHNGQIDACYTNAFKKIKEDPNHISIVMDYKGEIIGTLQLIFIQTLTLKGCLRAEVEGVRIKSSYRGLGLGKILFDWVKQTAILHNCGLIQLTTNKSRLRAQDFYKSIGYTDSHIGMKLILK